MILALYLARRGFSAGEIGGAFSATMVEDALLTLFLSTAAARLGPAKVMAATAPLIAFGGLVLFASETHAWLLVGAVLGTLSPNGQEAGPFAPMEQALLPGTIRKGSTVRAFAWYNLFSFLPSALGAAAGGASLGWLQRRGGDELEAYRTMLLAYAGVGAVLTALYVGLVQAKPLPDARPTGTKLGRFGLGPSKKNVIALTALQGLDALAGGFIIQALLAYWFRLRFGAGPEAIGALFFGTSLFSAVSFLVATRIAERFGLLNTMVFTHLPSNVMLLLVPFMPTFTTAAVALLLRHVLSQMDVPARQAYTVALVSPEERPAAAGLAVSVRALAQACAPALVGSTLAAATPAPFLLAGGLKIVYDLALYFRFRGVPLAEPARRI